MSYLLWRMALGRRKLLVYRWTPSGIVVNPDGTGTRDLPPCVVLLALMAISFTFAGRPVVTDQGLFRSGACIAFQNF